MAMSWMIVGWILPWLLVSLFAALGVWIGLQLVHQNGRLLARLESMENDRLLARLEAIEQRLALPSPAPGPALSTAAASASAWRPISPPSRSTGATAGPCLSW